MPVSERPAPRLVWQSEIYRIVESWTKNNFFDPEVPDETGPEWIQLIVVEVASRSSLGEPSWRETAAADLPNDALRALLGDVGLIQVQS